MGISQAALASDGIGATGVDDDGSNALAIALLDRFLAYKDRGGLKFVLGKDCRGGARGFRGDQGEVGKMRVGGFDTDMSPRCDKSSRIRPCLWDVFLLGWRDSTNARSRIEPFLKLGFPEAKRPAGQ